MHGPWNNFASIISFIDTIDLFSDEESHMDVHDRALLYYRLLKTNVKEVMTDWLTKENVETTVCE